MKIAFFSTKSYDQDVFGKLNQIYKQDITFFEARLRKRTANLTSGFEGVCVFVNDPLDAECLEIIAENGVKLIALRCAGFNNVDMPKATELGLRIFRVPAYDPHAVAEHALALILTLNRKTHKAYNRVKESNFSLEKLTGFTLFGKTVGIIGTGKIGEIFAEIMLGLGCKIVAFDHYPKDSLIEKGVSYLTFEEVLKQSHILSLHCPLNDETKHIISKKSLSMMKQGSMLINTSRGGLINTPDVIDSLKANHLSYLGIDVYEQEEKLFFKDLSETIIQDDVISRLVSFPNVLITAHQAFFTNEALMEIGTVTLNNIKDFEEGRSNNNEVKLLT
jgi:D-lactate dehydrogenase